MDLVQVVKGVVALALTSIFLVGCANEFDVQMVEAHMEAEKEIARAKSELGIAQSEAIAVTIDENSTDLERYLARKQIAGLEITPSGIKSITTGNDVVIELTEDGQTIIKDVITGAVIYRGFIAAENILEGLGGTTVTATEGSTINYSNKDQKAVSVKGDANVNDNSNGSEGLVSDNVISTSEITSLESCIARAESNPEYINEKGKPLYSLSGESCGSHFGE